MRNELPASALPTWLAQLTPESIASGSLPLHELLQGSLYYPSSGLDGDPVRFFAGNVHSFVYVDYGYEAKDLDRELGEHGFRGYRMLGQRPVAEQELAPQGWAALEPRREDGDPDKYRDWIKPMFCRWVVLERDPAHASDHGPDRFSFLYLCADGVTAFQTLYIGNGCAPSIVAIIQPGGGFGFNWTDFRRETGILARAVLGNPAGPPQYLLHGGIGSPSAYDRPIWQAYRNKLATLRLASEGGVVVWQRERHAEDAIGHHEWFDQRRARLP